MPLDPSKRTLVYVEDNPMNVRLMEALLARVPNVRLVVATTGRDGLAAARSEHPDLILLDVNLPDMSGEEVLSTLVADDTLAGIPVAVVTADDDEALRRRLLAGGARRVILKPFDVRAVKLALETELDPGVAPRDALDHRAVEALRSLPGAARLVADFIDEGRRLVSGMAQAAAGRDVSAVVDLSHRLSGVAGTFGAPGVGRLCSEIERAAGAGDLEAATRLVAAAVEEFELVAAELPAAFA